MASLREIAAAIRDMESSDSRSSADEPDCMQDDIIILGKVELTLSWTEEPSMYDRRFKQRFF